MAEAPAGGSASPRPPPSGLMAGTEAEGAEAGLPMGGAGGEAIGARLGGGGSGAILGAAAGACAVAATAKRATRSATRVAATRAAILGYVAWSVPAPPQAPAPAAVPFAGSPDAAAAAPRLHRRGRRGGPHRRPPRGAPSSGARSVAASSASFAELSFSATKLRNMDAFSKSDPMLVVYTNIKGKLEEIGRTEVILNSLEPSWITKATMSYQFEIVQPLIFRIYDVDTKYHQTSVKLLKLDQQDFLGEACCNLSEIVTKFNHSLTLNLRSDCGHGLHGTMTVHAEESDSSRMAVEMTLHCLNLENKDVLSKSDPFLRISKLVETAGPIPICKTEVVINNLNPVWRPITLTSQQYGSKDNPLLVECFDFESSGNHELIGAFQTTITQLENLYASKSGANFYSHKGQRKMKGQLFVDQLQEKVQHTFLDYISSGFELNFMVAVDFTASNGDPRVPQSLHYIDPSGRPNSYQQAILGVGEVLQFYDNDRRFPAWGFGARTQGHVSHCFNLNTATNDSEVVGVEGIMSAYTSSLYAVSLAGPTMFGPVINRAADIASQSLQYSNNKYFVLLIITDGVLTDIQETKDCIVRASDLPLSILIVGVGNADFQQMEILDADNGKRLESSTGRIATRDIVQFVPMREVQGGQISVVQSLLEELPGQFLQYMRTRGIKPQQQAPPGHASAPVYPPQQ